MLIKIKKENLVKPFSVFFVKESVSNKINQNRSDFRKYGIVSELFS